MINNRELHRAPRTVTPVNNFSCQFLPKPRLLWPIPVPWANNCYQVTASQTVRHPRPLSPSSLPTTPLPTKFDQGGCCFCQCKYANQCSGAVAHQRDKGLVPISTPALVVQYVCLVLCQVDQFGPLVAELFAFGRRFAHRRTTSTPLFFFIGPCPVGRMLVF